MSAPIVGVLLAAGQSLRFGSNKLLHPLDDNTPMLLVTATRLARALPDSVAVIQPDLETYTSELQKLGMRVVVNQQADEGMGRSIACGVGESPDAGGWLIALADMPYIETGTIKVLADRLERTGGIVRPVYQQQAGHPVGFAGRYKDELMALRGDVGARSVIEHHANALELLPTDDAGVITDIDQVADLIKGL
jgi:molybdenum cofactor cytidylyltransferase